jgi:hypothetical protein
MLNGVLFSDHLFQMVLSDRESDQGREDQKTWKQGKERSYVIKYLTFNASGLNYNKWGRRDLNQRPVRCRLTGSETD